MNLLTAKLIQKCNKLFRIQTIETNSDNLKNKKSLIENLSKYSQERVEFVEIIYNVTNQEKTYQSAIIFDKIEDAIREISKYNENLTYSSIGYFSKGVYKNGKTTRKILDVTINGFSKKYKANVGLKLS